MALLPMSSPLKMPSESNSFRYYFKVHFHYKSVMERFSEFNRRLEADRDRVRLHGQYYNNIYLGKRVFGPARKQMFMSTIMGGVERRFEIIENQVNHIPFTHQASDLNPERCRNTRVKCRDDTRVVLNYPDNSSSDFIHANNIPAGVLFNSFILTQVPMESTVIDFWRMIWQTKVNMVFVLLNLDGNNYAKFWPQCENEFQLNEVGLLVRTVGILPAPRFKGFSQYFIEIKGPNGEQLKVDIYHGDLNDTTDLNTPLNILRACRRSASPVVLIDELGISRGACLIAIEICLMNLLKGPSYAHLVQRAVHYLRSFRPFAVETPMQYIYIHRVVRYFTSAFVELPAGFDEDYERWLSDRSRRLFVDDNFSKVPAYLLLCPKVDPDLLSQSRDRERPENRREIHANVGELPILLFKTDRNASMPLPKRYPQGPRY